MYKRVLMPNKLINDYIFYKIVCLDNSVELCYVGSTANWKERQRTHKRDCNNENSKAYNLKIYKTIRENGGWGNFKMIQLGTREQLKKREAEQVEEEYRVQLKANMNGKRCYRTEAQKQEDNKEYCKNYREEKKDKIREQKHKWYEENKDKINEKALEKVKCECGLLVCKASLLRHQKRLKHIKLMNQNKN